ncbi:MAG: class I adenylate-forming enzyme family protein, partial [Bdellovibrionales bacterium]
LSGIAMQSLFAAASPADGFPAPRFTRGLDDDAIYVFSSGSTGESKIIRQTEGMLLTNVEALIRHHGLREKRKVIATPLPLFHVNALEFALFTSLLAGGELILFEHFDPDKLLTILQTRKIAIASLIPPMLRLLIERSKKGNFSFENLGYAVSAATALPKTVAKDFTERTGKRILQGYGLSEAVNFSCLTPTNLSDESYAKLMFDEKYCTIGTALWGNEVEILNSDGKPCPEREAGEIAIRGWNVMPGYLGDQDPRAQFRHGYLHTGDLGYWIELGGKKYYFISGRTKDCIKRAGETIPLRDIDDFVAGLRIAGLDAIAVPYPHVLMGEDFGLLCRPSQSSPADWQDALTLAFKNGFSQAMRPKSYQVTEEMIRTESGKPLRWKFSARFAP